MASPYYQALSVHVMQYFIYHNYTAWGRSSRPLHLPTIIYHLATHSRTFKIFQIFAGGKFSPLLLIHYPPLLQVNFISHQHSCKFNKNCNDNDIIVGKAIYSNLIPGRGDSGVIFFALTLSIHLEQLLNDCLLVTS